MRFFGITLLLFTLPVLADTEFLSQVEDVDYGRDVSEEVLVLLKNGRVAKLRAPEKNLTSVFEAGKLTGATFRFLLDDDRYVKDAREVALPTREPPLVLKRLDTTYVPTTIAGLDVARKYFRESRRTTKEETQCFNRAMVWTYEWWKRHSLKSNKILIFFTRNYIRRYNFEWWFHIAPYVHVMDNGKVVERVMDVKYSSGPIEFQRWTNIFMNKDPVCPVITKYSEYADHPYSGDCFFLRTHMYTYQPADLQMYEAWSYKKEAFNMDEVRGAYLEAFDIHL